MSETACSYEDLMTVARKLDIPQTELEQLYKRMVMNILGGNVDDHTKNFSFMLPRGEHWHITPAYDMTFTVDLSAMKYVNYHNLSVRGKVTNISEEDLLAFAKDNSIKNAARIIDQVANVLSNCWTYLIEAGVSRYWADKIEAYIAELLPERYQKTMLHSLPTKVSEYITNNGVCIRDIILRETRNGDLILSAFSEQEEKRWIINKKSSTFKDIKEKGWIHIEEKELIHLVETYIRSK
jgi:serine/threonine-protein kinase HipA